MTGDTWHRVWDLFHDCLERGGGERTAFLAAACGADVALRQEVERLLTAHDDAAAFLEEPAVLTAGIEASTALEGLEGGSVGPYRLLRQIGEGGMGVVYEAEQEEPLRRRVAVKLVKAGMDTREVLARFESERQALALMQHPGIARVLDAGTTPRGRSYFVMEHVQGLAITEYCDRNRLPLADRLRLFISVCEAIQHAHQKGIIHRDVKPSNVLVALEDGRPVAKVIDFGIAKATGRAGLTVLGSFIGTPEYMSPEQASLDSHDIDTRSDIFTLGVLLHQLLAGTLPLGPETFQGKSIGEIQRILREEDPPPLSGRFASLEPGEADRVARARGTDAKTLARRLRGELEWITSRALEKDRARRYPTASELAADVERYLAGQPVTAGPSSTTYRLRKFVRRNRALVAGGTLLAASLVAFAVAMTIQSSRIARALERADRERRTAERVAAFLVGIFQQSDPNEAKGATVTAREVLDRGAQRLDKELKDEPEVRGTLLHTVGGIYRAVGLYDRAGPILEESLSLRRQALGPAHPAVADTLVTLGLLRQDQGDYRAAETLFREALDLRRRALGERHQAVAESLDGLGLIQSRRGDVAASESLYREALAIRRALPENDAELAQSLNNVATALVRRRDYDGALALLTESLSRGRRAHGNEHLDVASGLSNLGTLYTARREFDNAEQAQREAVAIRRKLLAPNHPLIGQGLNNLAMTLIQLRRPADAEAALREALAIRRAAYPGNHPLLASALANLGGFLFEQGDAAAGEPLLREALAMNRALARGPHPAVAVNLVYLGRLLNDRGDAAAAEPLCREAVEIRRKPPANAPDIAEALTCLGASLVGLRRHAEAEPLLREAVPALRAARPEDPGKTAAAEGVLGASLAGQGRLEEAERLLLGSLPVLRDRYGPRTPQTRLALRTLVHLYERWRKPDAAARHRVELSLHP